MKTQEHIFHLLRCPGRAQHCWCQCQVCRASKVADFFRVILLGFCGPTHEESSTPPHIEKPWFGARWFGLKRESPFRKDGYLGAPIHLVISWTPKLPNKNNKATVSSSNSHSFVEEETQIFYTAVRFSLEIMARIQERSSHIGFKGRPKFPNMVTVLHLHRGNQLEGFGGPPNLWTWWLEQPHNLLVSFKQISLFRIGDDSTTDTKLLNIISSLLQEATQPPIYKAPPTNCPPTKTRVIPKKCAKVRHAILWSEAAFIARCNNSLLREPYRSRQLSYEIQSFFWKISWL